MIAPERWYEYEKKYQRYGFDMKPESELPIGGEKKPQKKSQYLSQTEERWLFQ